MNKTFVNTYGGTNNFASYPHQVFIRREFTQMLKACFLLHVTLLLWSYNILRENSGPRGTLGLSTKRTPV